MARWQGTVSVFEDASACTDESSAATGAWGKARYVRLCRTNVCFIRSCGAAPSMVHTRGHQEESTMCVVCVRRIVVREYGCSPRG
jgi:hypothetical protein